MADGVPNLRGSILIDTSTVKTAVKSVKDLGENLKSMADQAGRGSSDIETAIGRQVAAYKTIKKQLDGTSNAYRQITAEENRREMAIAKMANTVENFAASVRKSNLNQKQQAQILESVGSKFKGFEAAILSGADSGAALQRVTLQFNNALAKSKRELSETSTAINDYNKAWAENESRNKKNESTLNAITKAVAKNEDIYNELTNAVNESISSDKEKETILESLREAHERLSKSIQQYGVNSNKTVQAQIAFDRASKDAARSVKEVGNATKKAQVASVAGDFRNLTSSVVVALGPLSGVAARMTALQGIFDRNTAAMGVFLAGLTGMSVLFAVSARGAQMAEQQMLTLEAQIRAAGGSAQMTAKEINIMAHDLAAATLLSAEQVRSAAGALLEFGEIGRDQFDDVILAAQGMSVIMGGDLKENVRKLGRVMEDPITQMASLRESVGKLDEDIQRQIITLVEQGRVYEANNILLEQFKGLIEGAQGASKGLAGAYDTVMGNLDKLYEELMINSGALKVITDNVNTAATALQNFTESDSAAKIGVLFKTIAEFGGTALKAVINNIELLTAAFAGVVSYGFVFATVATLRLGNALTFNLIPATATLVKSLWSMNVGASAAAAGMTKLNFVMTMTPVGRVIMGLTKLAAIVGTSLLVYLGLEKAMDSAGEAQLNFAASTGKTAEIVLASNRNLTAIQRDAFAEQLKEQKVKAEKAEGILEDSNKELLRIEKELTAAKAEEYRLRNLMSETVKTGRETGEDPNVTLERVKRLGKEREKQAAQISALSLQQEVYNRQVAEQSPILESAKTRTAQLTEEIKNATKATEDDGQRKIWFTKTVKGLSEEYDKQKREIESLESQIRNAENALAFFSEGQNANAKFAQQLTRYLGQMREKLDELKFDKHAQEAQAFAERINATAKEVSKLNLIGDRGGDEAAQQFGEMSFRLAEMRESLSKMKPEALQNLAGMFKNADGSAIIGTNEQIIAQIMKIARLNETNLQKANERIARQQQLNTVMQAETPAVATVMKQYQDMASVADASQKQILDTWLQTQMDMAIQADSTRLYEVFGSKEKVEEYLTWWKDRLKKEGIDVANQLGQIGDNVANTEFWDKFAKGASEASQVASGAMEVMSIANRQSGKDGKNIAIANAVIAQAMAVANIWQGVGGIESIPAKIAMSALAAAKVGAQIAAIRQQKFASGGYVKGPGTGRSDSISAMLSNGEFVMSASAVRKLGVNNLEKMNKGQMPMFNTGGLIGTTSPGSFSSNTNVQIIDQSTGSKDFMVEETTNDFGQTQIKVLIKNAVKEGIVRGDFNREMAASYGLRQKGRSL